MSAQLDDYGEVLTVEEAMHVLRTGRTAMYQAIRRGEIPCVRWGLWKRRILIPTEGLRDYLARPAIEAEADR